MFKWTALHPYNAVHVLEIAQPLKQTELALAVRSALQQIGFSEIKFDNASSPSSFSLSLSDREPDIHHLPDSSPEALHREIEQQLNTPFLCGVTVHPYRWLAQDRGDRFVLAVTYFHVLADAESIVWLLRLCAENYVAKIDGQRTPRTLIKVFPKTAEPYLLHFFGPCFRRFIGIPAMALLMRHCYRSPMRDHRNFKNGYLFFSVPADRMRALQGAAKSWSVTVNDMFLGLLIHSVSGLASGRFRSKKRKRIAAGCIVNLRKELGFAAEPAFGLFLGSFLVSHECPDGTKIETLARDIRQQTALIKSRRLALGTPMDLEFGRLLFSLFSTERQKKLYQKNYPLWGGVTNMNLNAIWQQNGSAYTDYFRAVSTGPATPLVLSTTTAGERLNVGLTYRTAVFSEADLKLIKTKFIECINQL